MHASSPPKPEAQGICPVCAATCSGPDRRFLGIKEYVLLSCPACSLVFRPVDVAAWNAAELYGASYFCGDDAAVYGDYLGDEYGQRRMAIQRLRRLRSMVTAKVPK